MRHKCIGLDMDRNILNIMVTCTKSNCYDWGRNDDFGHAVTTIRFGFPHYGLPHHLYKDICPP